MLPFLHQPFHLAHLALEEAVDADLATVGVESDGGEAGERGVYHHARHRLVGDEVGVVVQQCRRFYGDALVVEDDGGGGVHIQFFPKMGTPCSDTKMPVRAHIGCRLHFFCQEMHSYGWKMSFSQY